jgi:type I restriction enzyme R subunit
VTGRTDTSERGLERLICTALIGAPCYPAVPPNTAQQRPAICAAGWTCGAPEDCDRECCTDLAQLSTFPCAAQPGDCRARPAVSTPP